MNYDIIKYDAGDIRNKSIIDTITQHNMADKNIMSMFYKKIQRIVIIMDEIDGMNNGDKGGINSLIKLIRPKKTKAQRLEEITMNPIICIGNYHIDKKINEGMSSS
jgi:Cdc6-like AAA superfamily ATPase